MESWEFFPSQVIASSPAGLLGIGLKSSDIFKYRIDVTGLGLKLDHSTAQNFILRKAIEDWWRNGEEKEANIFVIA